MSKVCVWCEEDIWTGSRSEHLGDDHFHPACYAEYGEFCKICERGDYGIKKVLKTLGNFLDKMIRI